MHKSSEKNPNLPDCSKKFFDCRKSCCFQYCSVSTFLSGLAQLMIENESFHRAGPGTDIIVSAEYFETKLTNSTRFFDPIIVLSRNNSYHTYEAQSDSANLINSTN